MSYWSYFNFEMKTLLILFLFFCCFPSFSGVLEPQCEPHYTPCVQCCAYEHKSSNSKLLIVERELKSLEKQIEDLKKEKLKYSLSINALEKKYDSDAINEWNIYMASWTLLGLMTAVAAIGAVFIVKENRNSKKAIELAEMEINFAKRKLKESVEVAIREVASQISLKAELELDIFRKRMVLMEVILTRPEVPNNDDIFDAVSYLSEYPRNSFLSLYNKLLELNIDEDVRNRILFALDKIEPNSKKSQ